MKQKLLIGFLFYLILYAGIRAQSTNPPTQMDRCYTSESYERLKALYPQYEQNRRNIEARINQMLSRREVIGGITVIPVVYHVIHNGDAVGTDENLSAALLQAQLDQMNDDFRRTNSDAGNTPADFTGVAADTEIEFCLAEVDPDGNPTTGINRVNISSLTGVDPSVCWYDSYIDANIKPSTIWDRDAYLNLWTVFKINRSSDCANTILGYAQFPGGPANTDGVVLRATTVGSLASPNPQAGDYRYGRTGTHEVGHYLNLIHIWGDGNCSVDDAVSDTPIADGPNYTGTPCTYPGPNSCNEGTGDLPDMLQNYMDYSDDLCMNLFTQGQADRMNAAITASRPGLLTSSCTGGCENALVISGTLNGTYTANNSITTSGATNVPSSNDVLLQAPSYVRLNFGFSTSGFAGLTIGYGTCSGAAIALPLFQTSPVAYFRTQIPAPIRTGFQAPTLEELKRFRSEDQKSGPSDDYSPAEKAMFIARDRKENQP